MINVSSEGQGLHDAANAGRHHFVYIYYPLDIAGQNAPVTAAKVVLG